MAARSAQGLQELSERCVVVQHGPCPKRALTTSTGQRGPNQWGAAYGLRAVWKQLTRRTIKCYSDQHNMHVNFVKMDG